MKYFLAASLFLWVASQAALAQEQELRWGEFGVYSNWYRYPYAIDSTYPFLGRLPDLREFPKLIKLALDPKLTPSDRVILLSQMTTLSRCNFEKRNLSGEDDVDAEFRTAIQKWQAWWQNYGAGLAQSLPQTGHGDAAAWKAVAPSPYLECPKYPISIPKQWSSTLSFNSGDYGSATQEVIEFQVNENHCELRRRYRTGWLGGDGWTHEIWTDFTRKEADHFFAALIYVIDNPWFFVGDELSEVENEKDALNTSHICGRPLKWTSYYPSFEWSGIRDADQRILINHDPWTWHTIDYKMSDNSSLDGVIGVVFRLVRDLFPDPSYNPDLSRWKKTAPPEVAPVHPAKP